MSDSKDKRPQDWDEIQTAFDHQPEGNHEALQGLLDNFRQDLKQHPYVRRQRSQARESLAFSIDWVKRLAIPVAALVLLLMALTFMSQPAPSWAQVVARFEAVPFFSASIYSKEDGLDQPEHIELWMGQGGLTRMRLGHQLIFAEQGDVQACFDLKTRKQVEPHEVGTTPIQILGSSESFSMDILLQAMAQAGVPFNQAPVLNENAMIDEDLVVFDLESDEISEWIRIWALKRTGLPVRIRVWDPSNAATMEVIFDYSKRQPERFFDPKAFASALGNIRTDELNLAYLFLEEAGGRRVVPGIANQSEAMNIVTTTLDGEPFALSHYADKILVLYFWNRGVDQREWEWIKEKQRLYEIRDDVKFVTVSLDKPQRCIKMDECLSGHSV